jgi:hypothetical protein
MNRTITIQTCVTWTNFHPVLLEIHIKTFSTSTLARKMIIEQLVFYAIALQRSLQLHHDDDHDHDHEKEESKFLPNTTQNPQEACRTAPPNETSADWHHKMTEPPVMSSQ